MARPGEPKLYANPFDVVKQTYRTQGVLGMWRGFSSSIIYRSNMGWLFGSRSISEAADTRFRGIQQRVQEAGWDKVRGVDWHRQLHFRWYGLQRVLVLCTS
jgi:hypothetical protein